MGFFHVGVRPGLAQLLLEEKGSMLKRGLCLAAAIIVAFGAALAPVLAAEFPRRSITWIVPYVPGGPTDITARIVAVEMAKSLGQPVVIDNRAGAGGTVGTELAARARPDGYTIVYGTQATMAANVSLRKSQPYDPLTDFVPVSLMGQTPNVLVAFADAPFNSVEELVAYGRQNPGKLSFASSGTGTGTHLVAELFKTVTGIEMLHVPYKGSAPAVNDLAAGRVDLMFDYPATIGPHVEAGRLKVLATTAPERLKTMPDAPTMAELGLNDMTTESWSCIMAPKGTPEAAVDRLAAAVQTALTVEHVRAHFEKFGIRPMTQQKQQVTPFLESEIKRWRDVIARAGLEKQ